MKKFLKTKLPPMLCIVLCGLLASLASYAWLSFRKSLSGSGIDMAIIHEEIGTVIEDENSNSFVLVNSEGQTITDTSKALNIPGKKAIYRIILKNETEEAIKITEIGLEAPNIYTGTSEQLENVSADDYDEIPRFDTDDETNIETAYYFGTELKVSLVAIYGADDSDYFNGDADGGIDEDNTTCIYNRGDFDDETTEVVHADITGFTPHSGERILTDSITASDVVLGTFLTAKPLVLGGENGSFLAIYVEVEFENKDEVQDIYKNFGVDQDKTKEVCKRKIYVVMSEEAAG